MSTSLLTDANIMELLVDCEDDIVKELCKVDPASDRSSLDPESLSKIFFRQLIITSDMHDNFTSLDHSRLECQLQVRYLLRLATDNIRNDRNLWVKFLSVLDDIGGISKFLESKLRSDINVALTNLTTSDEASVESTGGNISDDAGVENIILCYEDVGLLTELLVKVSHKWEEIATSLGLLEHERAEYRNGSNKIRLNRVFTCRIFRGTSFSLRELKEALNSNLVGEGRVALALVQEFIEAKEQKKSASKCSVQNTLAINSDARDIKLSSIISEMSNHYIEVADGKSTLLHVPASSRESISYHWKKDGQPLDNSFTYSGVYSDMLVIHHARQGTDGEYTCCVSSQGKEERSNEINLTVKYQASKEQLLKLYATEREVPMGSWPPIVSKEFINLALVKSSEDHKQVYDYSVRGDADDIIAKKEKIEYKEAFGKCKSREVILLEGRPGSGKTTLVHKIVTDWSKGSVLADAKLVFLVTLRRNFSRPS